MLNYARAYRTSTSEAWAELGYPPMRIRERRRLALACTELWNIKQVIDDFKRPQPKDAKGNVIPRDTNDIMLHHEVHRIYTGREFDWEWHYEPNEAGEMRWYAIAPDGSRQF